MEIASLDPPASLNVEAVWAVIIHFLYFLPRTIQDKDDNSIHLNGLIRVKSYPQVFVFLSLFNQGIIGFLFNPLLTFNLMLDQNS